MQNDSDGMSEVRYTLSGQGCGCVTVCYGTKERFVKTAKDLQMKPPELLRAIAFSVSGGEVVQLTEQDVILFLNRVAAGYQATLIP